MMKTFLKRFGNWLINSIRKVFIFLKGFIFNIPTQIRKGLFDFAAWGKAFLDKRINSQQRKQLRHIIFESETKEGRRFDTILIWVIAVSYTHLTLPTKA